MSNPRLAGTPRRYQHRWCRNLYQPKMLLKWLPFFQESLLNQRRIFEMSWFLSQGSHGCSVTSRTIDLCKEYLQWRVKSLILSWSGWFALLASISSTYQALLSRLPFKLDHLRNLATLPEWQKLYFRVLFLRTTFGAPLASPRQTLGWQPVLWRRSFLLFYQQGRALPSSRSKCSWSHLVLSWKILYRQFSKEQLKHCKRHSLPECLLPLRRKSLVLVKWENLFWGIVLYLVVSFSIKPFKRQDLF